MENLSKKENFLNALKRFGAFLLAFLLSFIAIAPSLRAETGRTEWLPGYYYSAGTYGQMTKLTMDGEDVFCLEPGKLFHAGTYSKGDINSILSESQKEEIELIHHFGYVLAGKGDRNRAFTQVAIWEIASGYTVKIGSSNGSNNLREDYESWLSDVKSRIDSLMNVPSWNKSTITGKVGDTIILKGEGKISGSRVTESNGSKVSAENGNIKIVITPNSKSGYIELEKRIPSYDSSKGVTLLYQKSGSQKVGKIRLGIDPPTYEVNLNITQEPTRAKVHKVGEEGEAVAGAVFEMCYSRDFKSKRVYTFKTGKNGYTDVDTWNLHGQTVYVREKSVPYPYIKSNEVKSFTVSPGKNIVIKFVNKKQNMKLDILKVGTDGEVVPGTVFYISYDKDFKKETYELETGEKGLTKLSEFKQFGRTLYVKEKSVPAPYIKSNEVKEVKVEPGKTKRLKFVNKKQKAKLKLAKVGEVLKEYKDEKVTIRNKSYNVKTPIFKKSFIAGAKFDIKQNGKVIKTVISKTDFIEVELSLGKYQVEEKEAPTGFVKTSKVYDVDLTGSSEVISKSLEIENEREKVKFNLTKSFEKGMFKNETYAVFGLFTKEKENTLEKDTLIEVLEFDKENSTKEFKNTIKGKYYVKELDNSSGYRKDEKNHDVDLSKEKVATKTIINKLKRGGIKIVKLDAKNKEIKLKDVKFRLLANNKERKEIGVYTTNENGEINIENLELGEYILEEIQTKDGYILDETQRIIRVKEDNKITMETVENDFTKVEISKTDITGEKELPGAKLKVVDSEGKTVEEWETDGKPHRINKMKVGKYKLIEEIAP
ncbi:SpaA isopeptide-forming pilin-related protein, partial [uncultured Parvimonas sp.]|uniref:SpaA isopeptide-forming pilin-related protein n=1 Tax=uncultured Parvimonas sp. TaxID=747372 RepID=UPI002804042A